MRARRRLVTSAGIGAIGQERRHMWKLATLIWIMVGTVVAGSLVVAVLVQLGTSSSAMRWMAVAGVGGYLIGILPAIMIAKRILGQTGRA